jgi:hypothetical protein
MYFGIVFSSFRRPIRGRGVGASASSYYRVERQPAKSTFATKSLPWTRISGGI